MGLVSINNNVLFFIINLFDHSFLFNRKLCIIILFIFCSYKEDGKLKYLCGAQELRNPERSTLEVSFEDVEKYNQNLSATIIEEYYRFVLC